MRTACVVFDFDGTILDTEWPAYAAWAEVYADHGLQLDRPAWQRGLGTRSADPHAEFALTTGAPLSQEADARRRDRRKALLAAQRVRSGIERWLEDAASIGVPVGIASSSPPACSPNGIAAAKAAGLYTVAVPPRSTSSDCDATRPGGSA